MKPVDQLTDEITKIIHDAIQDGLIRTERLKTFRKKIKALKGRELEEYIQRLWDQV